MVMGPLPLPLLLLWSFDLSPSQLIGNLQGSCLLFLYMLSSMLVILIFAIFHACYSYICYFPCLSFLYVYAIFHDWYCYICSLPCLSFLYLLSSMVFILTLLCVFLDIYSYSQPFIYICRKNQYNTGSTPFLNPLYIFVGRINIMLDIYS